MSDAFQPGAFQGGAFQIGAPAAATSGYTLTVTSSAVTLTGTGVSLSASRKISVTSAAVTLTGSSVALKASRKLAVTTAAVTLTGSSVTLTYAPVGAAILTVTGGTVALSGSSVGLRAARQLIVTGGSIVLTGTNATLTASNQNTPYPPITGGGYYREHKPQYRVHPEYEDAPRKKKRRKPEPDEQPFIIAPEPIVRKLGEIRPAWNTAAELMRSELEAAQAAKARAERIKAIVQADDEWLMTG